MQIKTVVVGAVISLGTLLAAKPMLNISGLCTEGSISDWRYESIDDTLAFLDRNKPRPNLFADGGRLATRYSDAMVAERPVDGFPSRSMMNMAIGRERFLIRVEVDRAIGGSIRHETNFSFSPNCLRLPISGI